MRPKHVPSFVLVLLVAALLVGVAGARISARAQEGTSSADGHPIVGSWSLLLAAGPPVQAPTLATFAADGTLLVTDLAQGTGHGAWTATGERAASFVFLFVRERRDGGFAGTTTFRGTVEVRADGASWSRSTLRGEETGPFGGPRGELRVPDGPLQLEAERIAVAPVGGAATPVPGRPRATPMADPLGATPVAATPVAAPAAAVTIETVDLSFLVSAVTIPANTPVVVTLQNRGTAVHGFAIDALGVSVRTEPGELATVVIDAPPGVYEFYSDVPGHRAAGMVGTLTVVEADATAATPTP